MKQLVSFLCCQLLIKYQLNALLHCPIQEIKIDVLVSIRVVDKHVTHEPHFIFPILFICKILRACLFMLVYVHNRLVSGTFLRKTT
jgi:hypothetical protein